MPPRKSSITERVRQSSAESSAPTVVETGDQGDVKDLGIFFLTAVKLLIIYFSINYLLVDCMYLQKPVHADVLLRIDSTNSESSRSSLKAEKLENKPLDTFIENTANAEIIAASQPTKSEESDGKSTLSRASVTFNTFKKSRNFHMLNILQIKTQRVIFFENARFYKLPYLQIIILISNVNQEKA